VSKWELSSKKRAELLKKTSAEFVHELDSFLQWVTDNEIPLVDIREEEDDNFLTIAVFTFANALDLIWDKNEPKAWHSGIVSRNTCENAVRFWMERDPDHQYRQ
jgi:hypothetical protein